MNDPVDQPNVVPDRPIDHAQITDAKAQPRRMPDDRLDVERRGIGIEAVQGSADANSLARGKLAEFLASTSRELYGY